MFSKISFNEILISVTSRGASLTTAQKLRLSLCQGEMKIKYCILSSAMIYLVNDSPKIFIGIKILQQKSRCLGNSFSSTGVRVVCLCPRWPNVSNQMFSCDSISNINLSPTPTISYCHCYLDLFGDNICNISILLPRKQDSLYSFVTK